MTGEAFFGELKKGLITKIPIAYARALMNNETTIFKTIQRYCNFEVAIGLNGKIWVAANDNNNTIIVSNAIKKAQHMTPAETDIFVKKIAEHMTK